MIRAVFRVQCDGPCRGWLLWSDNVTPGAALFPGERAARVAALDAGWEADRNDFTGPRQWRCPTCAANPLDTPPFPRQVIKVYTVTGEERDGDVPFQSVNADEAVYLDETLRVQTEGYARRGFRLRFPGWPIAGEAWSEHQVPPELSTRCVCTHLRSEHNANDLCVALPGVLGCGCLGWSEAGT